jgi:hypothetical protein
VVTQHANNKQCALAHVTSQVCCRQKIPATEESYSSNFDCIDDLEQQEAIIDERKSTTKSTTTGASRMKK